MTSAAGAQPSTQRRRTLFVASAAFLALGGLVSLYGPLFPALRERFGVGVDQVGAVVSAHFVGSLAAVVVTGELIRRFGYRRVLTVGAALLALGLAGLAPAPSWALFLTAAGVAGVGFGAVQVAVNLLVARTFLGGAASALNLINAVFGAGAVLSPVLVAAFAPRPEPPMWALTAVAALVLVAVRTLGAVPEPGARAGAAEPVAWGALGAFVLLYFGYVSAEVGVTSWSTEHLTPSLGAAAAAAVPGVYWGTLTVGRLVAAAVASRVRPGRLLLYCLAGAVLALLGALYTPAAPVMYGVVGLALAPTFATGLAWLTERMPRRAEQVSPAVFAAASVGPIATAPLIGVAVAGFGPSAVPASLASLAGVALVSAAWLRSRDPRPT
ncbi:MAG TPA: MFS transporter [Trueperaceae bacterium]|nr:MFS transporter [Trueperaceae bacterium]